MDNWLIAAIMLGLTTAVIVASLLVGRRLPFPAVARVAIGCSIWLFVGPMVLIILVLIFR